MLHRFPTCLLASLCITAVSAQDVDQAKSSHDATPTAEHKHLDEVKRALQQRWPNNRVVRLVFHGHSVPAGYFKTPTVRRFDSYPVLSHEQLCDLYPTAVIDACTTAIGGENSQSGAKRFAEEVLTLKPDVVFIDYCLNDRGIGVAAAEQAWRKMVQQALKEKVKIVLLTPTPDLNDDLLSPKSPLSEHARSIRRLGVEFGVPVVDSYAEFQRRVDQGEDVSSYLSQRNHPNRQGHEVVAKLIVDLFRSP